MEPILVKGAPGSPYTRKMIALLRYQRLPYRFLIGSHENDLGLPRPKVALLPTLYLRDERGEIEAVVDSTPLIRRLDATWPGPRSVLPPDPVVRFVDELIEDYADEWLTKAMFHYRWHGSADIDHAGNILPRWRAITASEEEIAQLRARFSRRQIDRLGVVGSNAITAPVIEESYRRFLGCLNQILSEQPFILGARPGSADLATYGQLTQLAHFDPTPRSLTLAEAPRVFAWVDVMDDLSGLDVQSEGWLARNDLARGADTAAYGDRANLCAGDDGERARHRSGGFSDRSGGERCAVDPNPFPLSGPVFSRSARELRTARAAGSRRSGAAFEGYRLRTAVRVR